MAEKTTTCGYSRISGICPVMAWWFVDPPFRNAELVVGYMANPSNLKKTQHQSVWLQSIQTTANFRYPRKEKHMSCLRITILVSIVAMETLPIIDL